MAKILLLEADRQLSKRTADYFSREGHQVDWYCDPQTAVKAADAGRPDAIILDLSLAARSGIEFLYELRSYPDWQAVPVIVTGWLAKDEQSQFAAAFDQLGVAGYLPKQSTPLGGLAAAVRPFLRPAKV